MQVVEMQKDDGYALTVSIASTSSAEFAQALPELQTALLDWMERRHAKCAFVFLTLTIGKEFHDAVQQELENALRANAHLAPLLKKAKIQVALFDGDGAPTREYELTEANDTGAAIQAGAGPVVVAAAKSTKPPPPRKSVPARDKRKTRERQPGGRDPSPIGLALLVLLVLTIPGILALCMAVVVLAGGAFVLAPAHHDVQALLEAEAREDAAMAAMPAPNPPPDVPGKKTIDLIPWIDPARDAVENRKWAVRNNTLFCDDSSFVPRCQIPYQPPQEYDFVVVFSQPGLRNGISLIMPNPSGGGSFFWYLGAGNGSQYGFHANPNKGGDFQGLIQPNVACTTIVQVRKGSVKGLVNGKELVVVNNDYRSLLCDGWRNIPDKSLLAVACDDPAVFHFVRVVEITGEGKHTR